MRRRIIIIGFILWVLLIIVLLLNHLHHQPKRVNLYRATPGGKNIVFPYLADEHTIDFFTGSAFATYDTRDQTTQTVTPQFVLPTVTQVRWSKTGILFEASDYKSPDDLFNALNKKGLSVTREYWWEYDYASKKLTLVLPANVVDTIKDAAWNTNGNGYCYVSSDGSLYLSSAPSQAVAKVGDTAQIRRCNGSTVVVAEGSLLKQIDTKTRAEKILVNAAMQDSYVSPDGQTIAYVLNTHPKANSLVPGDLYKVDTSTGKAHKVLGDFNGPMAGNKGNLYVGYTDQTGNNHLELFPANGKATSYALGASLNKGDTISHVLPVDADTIYVVSQATNLVAVSDKPRRVVTPVSNEYKIQTDLYENGFEIHYDPYANSYEVDISANPFLGYQAAALQYIRNQGVDPNQINIAWRGYDNIDTTNPAVDTTPVPVPFLGL